MGILDALDKSFGPDGSGFELADSSQPAGGSNPAKNAMREALLAARAKQREGLPEGMDLDDEVEFSSTPLGRFGFTQGKAAAGGFNLRYDQETPLRAIDVGGPDQNEKLAEFVSKAIDNNSHDLDVETAMKELGLENPKDILPGLEVRLLGHQAIGVAWMLKMELGEPGKKRYRGGILADDMGLGKTVQMIAVMSKNMPDSTEQCKTTLIVVPAALMQQWKEEVESKTNGLFTVHIHHGKDKLKKVSQVKRKDVVITSYQTLNMDFATPHNVEPIDEAEWLAKHGGVLAQTHFYRVIADEAQFIRNRGTRSSTSMALVQAKYRWMLTGTPVTNTLADLYGLLRFGRFAPWNDWNSFNAHIARVQVEDAPLAGARAQAILKPLLLRRTKDSELEGKPILDLPPKDIELVKLQFTKDEREVYETFEKRTKITVNKFIRERTLLKNHAQVLVMILRLRQVCCHPHLVLSQTGGYEDPSLLVGSDNEKEIGRARKSMGQTWVTRTKQAFLARATAAGVSDLSDEDEASAPSCPVCSEGYSDNSYVLPCGHEMCFDCILNVRNSPIAIEGEFGGSEQENVAAEKAFEEAEAKGHRPCPTCKKMIDMGPEKTFKAAAFEPTDDDLDDYYARSKRRGQGQDRWGRDHSVEVTTRASSPSGSTFELSDSDDLPDIMDVFKKPVPSGSKSKGKKNVVMSSDEDSIDEGSPSKSRGKRKSTAVEDDSDIEHIGISPSRRKRARETPRKGKDDADGPSDAVLATWSRGDDDMEPSTKMKALVGFLKEWDASGDKVICYSQWTSMLDLLDILLSRHGIRSLRFDGKMDRISKDQTLSQFKQPGGPKIILISTRCGSVGLNLVSANRVVNMDLSWNYAAESQAYDRCHRIGQDKAVYVKRLVVENTIEERMLKLQDVKVSLAEAALGEGSGAKLHKLSVKDIKYLFGMDPAKKPGGAPIRSSNHSRPGSESP